ncbi:glycosyltransferase family 2 protein [Flavobacterium sp. Arc3]|uniref:glycosyltransferase family 2 protein n=1 Tax=Flavobacterium sp. Arc3 TaxID=3046686 RepID=UPI00352FB3E2
MKPLISIIIPTYNRANLICDALDSVLAQTYTNWECIIVDDGSTDNTPVIINAYLKKNTRFNYCRRPEIKSKGPSSCRNVGLDNANGKYVIFLDSDDLLVPTCLENRIKFALQNLEFDFWIFKMSAFEETIDNVKFVYENIQEKNESEWCKKEFMKGIQPFVVTGPLWKKSVLLELNGFNEEMTMIEDPELHLRALKKGFKLKYANFLNSDCYYRLSVTSVKYTLYSELNNNLLFFKIYLNKEDREVVFYFKKMIHKLALDKKYIKGYFQFCLLGLRKEVLTVKNVLVGFVVLVYNSLCLNKFNRLGYNLLKKEFNNF